MKYIRTEHNIFEVVEETDLIYRVKAKSNPNKIYSKSKCQTRIVKYGFDIESVCDEFIFVSDKWVIEHRCHYNLKNAITLCQKDGLPITEIKGAIWTDKGLIYVAKLNEKGKLELL